MIEMPLLLRACLDGEFGRIRAYESGSICEAGFVYLLGKPNVAELAQLGGLLNTRMFVCISPSWERELLKSYPQMCPWKRYQMGAETGAINASTLQEYIAQVDAPYKLVDFDEAAFKHKPFGHGVNYRGFEQFRMTGSGANALCNGSIVASAASFISHKGNVELDIATAPEHRRKGLALACASRMLLDCKKRNITVHWDAQTLASKQLAEKLGYKQLYSYTAYCMIAPETC